MRFQTTGLCFQGTVSLLPWISTIRQAWRGQFWRGLCFPSKVRCLPVFFPYTLCSTGLSKLLQIHFHKIVVIVETNYTRTTILILEAIVVRNRGQTDRATSLLTLNLAITLAQWPWLSVSGELWSWPTYVQKIMVKGQLDRDDGHDRLQYLACYSTRSLITLYCIPVLASIRRRLKSFASCCTFVP